MTNYRWAIEQVEISLDESEAVRMLIGLAQQGGYLGGRILTPSPEKPDGYQMDATIGSPRIIS